MIFNEIVEKSPPGTVIPKPRAIANFVVKGLGTRRGEEALIYLIPNHKNPDRPYQKGITKSEFDTAYEQLISSGSFTKSWFDNNLLGCSSEGSCNFTTIGGLFQLIGIATYQKRGTYGRS